MLPGSGPDGQYPTAAGASSPAREDEAYINDIGHTGVYDLNTICNYDPDIIPLLSAPFGAAYAGERTENSMRSPLKRRRSPRPSSHYLSKYRRMTFHD